MIELRLVRTVCSGSSDRKEAKCARSLVCECCVNPPQAFISILLSVAWQGLVLVATNKETEAQSGEAVCLKSHSKEDQPKI